MVTTTPRPPKMELEDYATVRERIRVLVFKALWGIK
jgi:hypothetical protein